MGGGEGRTDRVRACTKSGGGVEGGHSRSVDLFDAEKIKRF